LEAEKARLYEEVAALQESNYGLMRIIDEREATINDFQGQIERIAGTVGTLEKLSQTDEELLKKYSKVYFLNENYVPAALSDIDEEYLFAGTRNFLINAKVGPYLRELLEEAREDGHKLLVASAYRSFATQSALKSAYTTTYGSGANSFSADQGYSEHQLGTAVDFTTPASGSALLKPTDPAYEWLNQNAHDYGFVLSYPPNNAYYKFEPWHWRYVGVALATDLHEEGKRFYDLDQREIDEYLIELFD
jgi:LAS superfamily LD-carboxypeptidase LdcB